MENTIKLWRNIPSNYFDKELTNSDVQCKNDKYQNIVQELKKVNENLETLQQTMLSMPNQIAQAFNNQANPDGQQQTSPQISQIEKWICQVSMSPTSSLSSSYSDNSLEKDFERLSFDVEDKGEIETSEETTTGLSKHTPASKLFAHWQEHYNTKLSSGQDSKFLFGSFAPASPVASPRPVDSSSLLASTSRAPKILPYNANIDLSIWLK